MATCSDAQDPETTQCLCGDGYAVEHRCCSGPLGASTVTCRLANGNVIEKGDLKQDTQDPDPKAPESPGTPQLAVQDMRTETQEGNVGFPPANREFFIKWSYVNVGNGVLLEPENYREYADLAFLPSLLVNSTPAIVIEAPWSRLEPGSDPEERQEGVTLPVGSYIAQIAFLPTSAGTPAINIIIE